MRTRNPIGSRSGTDPVLSPRDAGQINEHIVGDPEQHEFPNGVEVGDPTVAPAAPTGLAASAGLRSIQATWNRVTGLQTAESDGGYEVQISTSASFTSPTTLRVGSLGASWTDLNPSTLYYVRVRSVQGASNYSAWSASTSATTLAVAADIGPGEITTTKIADNAISTPKLQANAVKAGQLDAISISTGKYIRSANYNGTGFAANNATVGWNIDPDGMEAIGGRFRGQLTATSFITGTSSATARVRVASGDEGQIDFLAVGGSSRGSIGTLSNGIDLTSTDGSGNNTAVNMVSGSISSIADVDITMDAGSDIWLTAWDDIILTSTNGSGDGRVNIQGPNLSINTTKLYRNGTEQPTKYTGWVSGVSTSLGGDLAVSHGSPGTPSYVGISLTGTSAAHTRMVANVIAKDSSTFTVRFTNSNTGAAYASELVYFDWTAEYYP